MGAAQGLHAEFGRDKTSLSGRLRRFAKRCFQAPAPVWGCADYARYCTLAALVFPFVWVPGANRPSAGPGHPATGAGTGSATRREQRHPLRGAPGRRYGHSRAHARTGRATSPGAGHRHGHRRAGPTWCGPAPGTTPPAPRPGHQLGSATATGPAPHRRGQRHQHGHRYGHGAGRTAGAVPPRAPAGHGGRVIPCVSIRFAWFSARIPRNKTHAHGGGASSETAGHQHGHRYGHGAQASTATGRALPGAGQHGHGAGRNATSWAPPRAPGQRYGAGRRHRGTNTTGADRARAPGAPPGTTTPAQRCRRGAAPGRGSGRGNGATGTPIAPNSCNVRGKPTAAAGFQTRASKGRQTGSKKQGREGVSNTEKKKKFSSYKKISICPRFVPVLSPFCPRLPIGLKPA